VVSYFEFLHYSLSAKRCVLMPDIIIPVLNEEKILTEQAKYYLNLKQKARVVFVDGGSTDRTVEIACAYGEVVCSPVGRGIQKNRGAEETASKHLLFLHVDSFIEEDDLDLIDQTLEQGAVGGCLTMRIQDKGFIFRVYEKAVNFRARAFGVIDGDLGMFMRRDIFEQLGGFDHLPYMEDLVFAKKLRKTGLISILAKPIHVSSRKWRERGFVRTFWEYTIAYLRLWNGSFATKYHNGPQRPRNPVPQEKL